MDFACFSDGERVDLVCSMKVFDYAHSAHLMKLSSGCMFHLDGLIDDGFEAYTLFGALMGNQFPIPMVRLDDKSKVLTHTKPSWNSLHSLIDICAGFGGLAQGAIASGMHVAVAVDHNQAMLDLYSKVSDVPKVCGDFGQKDVLFSIWQHAKGAKVMSSGFSCQPYSRLGDGRSSGDVRSNCITKTLSAAYFLQVKALILECVSPAGHDQFVKAELERFMKGTGFTCSMIDMRLDSIWPCRRQRAWWLLLAPEFGNVELKTWDPLLNVPQVQHVIPRILPWAQEDEDDLQLDATELSAFGVNSNEHGKYLLNGKGHSPCALHAWGNQLRACPCGCRAFPLSSARLESRGLHGCLVRSASTQNSETHIRHVHPNEAMALNTMDPILDFGCNARLTLSAVGQLAAPAQSLWIFSHFKGHIEKLLTGFTKHTPSAQVQAYRSWLLMRCRNVWPVDEELISDQNLLSMMRFWHEYKGLSLEELVFSAKWQDVTREPISIAAVLDHVIMSHQTRVPPTLPEANEDVSPTPWHDSPCIVDDITTIGCLYADSCTVVFEGSADSPIRFQPKCCSTVGNFLTAQGKLVGELQVEKITLNGREILPDHVMEVGQVIVVKLSSHAATVDSQGQEEQTCVAPVSPTIDWVADPDPIEDCTVKSPPRKISKYDIGECLIPSVGSVSEDVWLDATPLLGLHGDQFLKLHSPTINTPQQLWSVRHQFLRAEDRLAVMAQQEAFWADDEIRLHMHAQVRLHRESSLKKGFKPADVQVLDPLLSTTWLQQKGFPCELWAKDHPEIRSQSCPLVTVVLVEQHWIPVFCSPTADVLHIHTWDGRGAQHTQLNAFLHKLAEALGFREALICREQRIFYTTDLCGALSIAFLRSMLIGTQLPTNADEAAQIHCLLRQQFHAIIQQCQVTDRPWIWGAGDTGHVALTPATFDAISIDREARIDLINQNGTMMADDEIRFHIRQLVQHQPSRPGLLGSFVFLEPLVFMCWDTIGHVIAETWCEQNPQVFSHSQHVVTAVAVENHWLPLWFVPDGHDLQIHTFNDPQVSDQKLAGILQAIATRLGFRSIALHRIPKHIKDDTKCGAYAMAFLAHVITRMPLPTEAHELQTLHTNMRASFVAHLYSIDRTPRPVVWGNGPTGESGLLPIMPDGDSDQDSSNPVCCYQGDYSPQCNEWPIVSAFCTCLLPARDPDDEARQRRVNAIAPRGHAMGDDEIMFHLDHLLRLYHLQPRRSTDVIRHFVAIPPLTVAHWLAGNNFEMDRWIAQNPQVQHGCHILMVACVEQHWVPFWLIPRDSQLHCHSFHHARVDTTNIDQAIRTLSQKLGFHDCMLHRVPNPVHDSGLCGAMAISFLAHIVLRTPIPADDQALRDRSWQMKNKFANTVHQRPPTFPVLWGWGLPGECRPLPKLPATDGIDTNGTVFRNGLAMGHDEMEFHLGLLCRQCISMPSCRVSLTAQERHDHLNTFNGSSCSMLIDATLQDHHWSPIIATKRDSLLVLVCEAGAVDRAMLHWDSVVILLIPSHAGNFCGAHTLAMLALGLGLCVPEGDHEGLHWRLRQEFCSFGQPAERIHWGFGPAGQLLRNLTTELLKHGVPEVVAESRANDAIRVIGSEQLITALNHRQVWKQLKMLGNNSKFQFIMPSELEHAVSTNKSKIVGGKGKGKSKGSVKGKQPPVDLDPHKLQIVDGIFRCHTHAVSQIKATQIGPLSSGVVLMTQQEAEPYLRAGKIVSQEPLAIAVLHKSGSDISTTLPHADITIPCRCTVDSEPILADAVLVQIGQGLIEKSVGPAIVQLDALDVVTLKILVYKDEIQMDWNDFTQAPIKWLVSLLPALKRCHAQSCSCPAWHNPEQLAIKDPILDVWRRQFLRHGFKPCPPAQADMFSVCIRIPQCLLEAQLSASGHHGAYGEPRTPDGKEILQDFTVIWTPKLTLQDTQHLMSTNPAVIGLARLGDRRGLRVKTAHAKAVHQQVRPESVFLPQGPRCLFTVGPMPYGVDRQAVGKMLSSAGWECRPLQPTMPCPGRGVMWSVQSTEDPVNTIIHTSHGEIVVTKQKQENANLAARQVTVGSASTIALCEKSNAAGEPDPWSKQDPWGGYKPAAPAPVSTGPSEGVQQMEDRIQTAVLAKLQTPMEQDDLPDRVHALEGQVQHLLSKQQGFETQLHEFSGHHTQQLTALQGQVNAQSQQLHGHLESQNQTIQSLFEQQMTQIRTLLAKRPREDGTE